MPRYLGRYAVILLWFASALPALAQAIEPRADIARVESLLQRARGSSDPALYKDIEAALARIDASGAAEPASAVLHAWYEMSQHNFKAALRLLEPLRAARRTDARALGLLADALVETGRYEEAVDVVQAMLDHYPGLPAYSRAAHLRYLYGDGDGALELSARALADAGADVPARAFVRLQRAEYLIALGQGARAQEDILAARSDAPAAAQSLLARLRMAQGRAGEAQALLAELLRRQPAPDTAYELYLAALAAGDRPAQRRMTVMLGAMARLESARLYRRSFAAFLSLQPQGQARALELARAEYEDRPDIYSELVLGEALFRSGAKAEAARVAASALRLGTPDPVFRQRVAALTAGQP